MVKPSRAVLRIAKLVRCGSAAGDQLGTTRHTKLHLSTHFMVSIVPALSPDRYVPRLQSADVSSVSWPSPML